jgi:hypothetical protein
MKVDSVKDAGFCISLDIIIHNKAQSGVSPPLPP